MCRVTDTYPAQVTLYKQVWKYHEGGCEKGGERYPWGESIILTRGLIMKSSLLLKR